MPRPDFAVVRLARGRDAALRRRHPWVFSGAISRIEGGPKGPPAVGETVRIESHGGDFLAWGAFSPQSQIRARAWSFDPQRPPDAGLVRRRLVRAAEWRRPLLAAPASAARLVHGESDGLPGLIVDRFASVAVVQLLSAGAERWREVIVESLLDLPGLRTVYERSDTDARSKEGLEQRSGLLAGEPVPRQLEIVEDGRRFRVDVESGHKTGFYLDQRVNRGVLADLLGSGAAPEAAGVLDVFCYTGGFSIAAASAGAGRLTQIDASGAALAGARHHLAMASWPGELEQIEGNAFGELRRLRAEERRFDLIVLDPPKFADSKARVERASRGYKDINLLAFQLLRAGGHLLTFSCSGRVSTELFGKIVAAAAADAGRDAQVIARLGPGPDHPASLAFPEGAYLKGLVCRVP